MSSARRWRREAGFATAEWLVAVAMSFLFMVMLINVVAVEYGRGVLRAAADEGARAGALVADNPIALCTARETDVLSGMGKMASNVTNNCVLVNGQVQARTAATFAGWLPIMPSVNESATAVSVSEKAQAPQ